VNDPIGYPAIPRSKTVSLIRRVKSLREAGHLSDSDEIQGAIDANSEIRGVIVYPMQLPAQIAARLRSHFKTMTTNELEEFYITEICPELETLPTEALQDPDHWRWLAISEFWDYIMRLEKDFSESKFGGDKNSQLNRWVLLRGYRWFLRTRRGSDTSLATVMREIREQHGGPRSGVRDEYQSQVVRPNLYMHDGAGVAMVRAICDYSPFLENKDGIEILRRQFGPSVRRMMENTYAPSLTEDELTDVFSTQHPSTEKN